MKQMSIFSLQKTGSPFCIISAAVQALWRDSSFYVMWVLALFSIVRTVNLILQSWCFTIQLQYDLVCCMSSQGNKSTRVFQRSIHSFIPSKWVVTYSWFDFSSSKPSCFFTLSLFRTDFYTKINDALSLTSQFRMLQGTIFMNIKILPGLDKLTGLIDVRSNLI